MRYVIRQTIANIPGPAITQTGASEIYIVLYKCTFCLVEDYWFIFGMKSISTTVPLAVSPAFQPLV